MASNIRGMADALAAGLGSITWAVAGTTVARRNWAAIDLVEMAHPVMLVTPGGVDVSRIGRMLSQIDYTVHVFVGRRCDNDAQVNETIDLADEVLLQVRSHIWSAGVTWPAGATSPNSVTIDVDPDNGLSERNVWRAMLSAVYRVIERDALLA